MYIYINIYIYIYIYISCVYEFFVQGRAFLRSLTRRRQDSKAEPRGYFSDQLILGDVQHLGQSKHPETHPEIRQASEHS